MMPSSVERTRLLVEPALRSAVGRLHPSLARVAAYHRGWVDAEGHDTDTGGGKALRPALALVGAGAVRADVAIAVPAAVAVELVHDFSLLHDDLMDGDAERRHRPTAWSVFGTARALLAGDGLLAVAYGMLESPVAQRILADAVDRLVAGQADDLDFESRIDVTYADYLAMSAGKTGALLGAAACLGAALGGGTAGQIAALAAYGEELGLAFQLVDDLLGVWGDPAVTGKPVLSDLRSRKKSAPVVLAAAESAAVRAWLAGQDADLEQTARLIEATGAREHVRAEVAVHVALAGRALVGADLEPTAVDELLRTAEYVTGRDR